MDAYTEKTSLWLEDRFNRGVAEGRYEAHRPIYGFGVKPSERNHTARMSLAYAILQELNRLNASTFADLGGGEGYMAALARDTLGYESILVELAFAACDRGRELFGLPAYQGDVHALPFEDNSIEVVLLSEVIEHLRNPLKAMAEAYRVASKAVIITTQ
ncbi:class I SAM-dependent methyltransferase [bacterium]|nr:class I SAM-dependent methyltransferase [bacterium]